MLELIRGLYEVDRAGEQSKLAPAQIAELRQQKAQPILEKIHGQLESLKDQTPPQGLLGKAVGYALGQWERLTRYVENGILRPDNNLAYAARGISQVMPTA